MTRNVELLQQTMQHITDHPEQHRQGQWVYSCGTVACYAGWASMLSGMTAYEIFDVEDMWTHGAKLLGLTHSEAKTLFSIYNTRPMLELMVKDLVNGSELRSHSEYEAEVES